jgi:proline iminopeptidase
MQGPIETVEPFKAGYLEVSDGNKIYWETSGNPNGKPALFLHGGPGSGIKSEYRNHFNPEKFLIVSLDQRGCGRSRPLATDPTADLSTNNTKELIADIEELRKFLQIEAWLVTGISWGTTLSIAYAQTHSERVTEMVLGAITTTSTSEITWITESIRNIFPIEWEKFRNAVEVKPSQHLIDAYYEHITHPKKEVRKRTAKAWCEWEDVHVSMDPNHKPSARFNDPEFCLLFSTLVIHYWKHSGFMGENEVHDNMDRISHIPSVLIHGRLDVSSPLVTAWQLHKQWEASDLIIEDTEGHGGVKMKKEMDKAVSRFENRN